MDIRFGTDMSFQSKFRDSNLSHLRKVSIKVPNEECIQFSFMSIFGYVNCIIVSIML